MLQRDSDGGRKPSGLDQLLRRDQRSPSEDNHGGGGFCSSTVPALGEHLEEKQRFGFQFEKETGARRERRLLLQWRERGLWERHSAKVLLGSVTSPQLSDCFWGRNRQALAFREALVTYISSLNSRGHKRVAKEAGMCSQTPPELYHITRRPLEAAMAVAGGQGVSVCHFSDFLAGKPTSFHLGKTGPGKLRHFSQEFEPKGELGNVAFYFFFFPVLQICG